MNEKPGMRFRHSWTLALVLVLIYAVGIGAFFLLVAIIRNWSQLQAIQ